MLCIKGAKAGEKSPKPPYISPDTVSSIAYYKLLYILSEGEIAGPVDGLRSIYLDDTPIMDSNGNLNYQNVTWEFRPGTVDQDYIQGFPNVESEIPVGLELRSESPFIRAISNTNLDAVRVRLSWPALWQQDNSGNVLTYRIDYVIEISTDGGSYVAMVEGAVSDKASNKYERSHRVTLPKAKTGWQIRIRRLTANANNQMIADSMTVEALTEIIDVKLSYPHTAMGGLVFDAQQFTNVPKFSALMRGRIIKVPDNYDPESRTYSGIWLGAFKLAYTNNPAWIWYDLVLNPRYGLGHRIDASMVDKWELYKIAQYCDELVSDGRGGKEPRFTCNVYLQTQEEGYTVLSDIASIFNGMSYWDGQQMVCLADMPADVRYTFSRANIVNGEIDYSGSRYSKIHTIANVAWDNPEQKYKTEKEPIPHLESQRKYGIRPLEVGAFGCTSLGQAQRAGKWALVTEYSESQVASFRIGLDGRLIKPGDLIKISDELKAGRANGGRLVNATDISITIDRITKIKVGDTVIVNLPSGKAQSRTVQQIKGRTITVTEKFTETPEKEANWVVDSKDLATMLYRVIARTSPNNHQYEITAIQHNPYKYDEIDNGAKYEKPPITVVPPGTQQPPKNVTLSQYVTVEQGMAVTTMTIAWEAAPNAIAYKVEWRREGTQWISVPTTGGLSIDIKGIYSGNYMARVYAINAINVSSIAANSTLTYLEGKAGTPPEPAYLRTKPLFLGIQLEWGFPQKAEDTAYTEIEESETADGQNPITLGQFPYPQDTHVRQGLSAGKRLWYRARLVDRTGNRGKWSNWIGGIASNDAGAILEILEGKITSTQLAAALLEAINSGGGAAVEVQKLVDELAAMYNIKTQVTVDGRTYIAGIGVGVENKEGIIESQVLVAADRFAVIHPNGEGIFVPFVIEDGAVYMDTAFIKNGSITNAMISGAIQSDDYIPNKQGWRIDKAGILEFNGSIEGGGRLSINNQQVRVYDANGTLRVRLGIWET